MISACQYTALTIFLLSDNAVKCAENDSIKFGYKNIQFTEGTVHADGSLLGPGFQAGYVGHITCTLESSKFRGTMARYIIIIRPSGSRVVSVLDSGAVGPGFKSQPRRRRVTVLGKLFTPIMPLFTKHRNW